MVKLQKLSEGAEAIILSGEVFRTKIVLKARKPKRYRTNTLDDRIRRQRTKKEAKILKKSQSLGILVPPLLGVGQTTIAMGNVEGRMLKDMHITTAQASQCAQLLAKLHNAGIVHGDFTPANLMETRDGICLIDFGLAEITSSDEERALDVLLIKRQMDKDLFTKFASTYLKKAYCGKSVLSRLGAIEERGRYQSRTLD